MSILKEWRDVAANCPNTLTRKLIRDTADELQGALHAFVVTPSKERLRVINGLVAKGERYVDTAITPTPTPPLTDAGEVDDGGPDDGVELARAA